MLTFAQRCEIFANNLERKIYCKLIRRFATDTNSYISAATALKVHLRRMQGADLQSRQRALIRTYRNAMYASVERCFIMAGKLGSGAFGRVDLVASRETNKLYALKRMMIASHKSLPSYMKLAVTEKDAMFDIVSPYIVKLKHAWIESGDPAFPDSFCFLTEFMMLGDLRGIVKQLYPLTAKGVPRRGGHMNEAAVEAKMNQLYGQNANAEVLKDIRRRIHTAAEELEYIRNHHNHHYMVIIVKIMNSLLQGVKYLHNHNIVHRDLKPPNILVSQAYEFKIADLGLATPFKSMHKENTFSWAVEEDVLEGNWCTFNYLQTRYEMEDFEKQKTTFEASRAREEFRSQQAGTFNYLPPEIIIPAIEYRHITSHNKPRIVADKHFPSDNYALGIIFLNLCNGLDLAQDHRKLVRPNASNTERLRLIKGNPARYNHFLYDQPTIYGDDFLSLDIFLDQKFLTIVRRLLDPKPETRATAAGILDSSDFIDLVSSFPVPNDQELMTWNQFTSTNTQPIGRHLYNAFLHEDFVSPAEEEMDMAMFHKIPDTPLFPVGTGSPYIAYTPPTYAPPAPDNADVDNADVDDSDVHTSDFDTSEVEDSDSL